MMVSASSLMDAAMGAQPHRAAAVFLNAGHQYHAVDFVETQFMHAQKSQCFQGYRACQFTVRAHSAKSRTRRRSPQATAVAA